MKNLTKLMLLLAALGVNGTVFAAAAVDASGGDGSAPTTASADGQAAAETAEAAADVAKDAATNAADAAKAGDQAGADAAAATAAAAASTAAQAAGDAAASGDTQAAVKAGKAANEAADAAEKAGFFSRMGTSIKDGFNSSTTWMNNNRGKTALGALGVATLGTGLGLGIDYFVRKERSLAARARAKVRAWVNAHPELARKLGIGAAVVGGGLALGGLGYAAYKAKQNYNRGIDNAMRYPVYYDAISAGMKDGRKDAVNSLMKEKANEMKNMARFIRGRRDRLAYVGRDKSQDPKHKDNYLKDAIAKYKKGS